MLARENVEQQGIQNCSLNDLLRCLVGTDDINVDQVWSASTPEELKYNGFNKRQADKILMLMEFAKRMNTHRKQQKKVDCPQEVYKLVQHLRYETQEHFMVICLNNRGYLIGEPIELTKGTATETSISTQQIYKEAIMRNALRIIIVHNHPSGDTDPSRQDKLLTRSVREAGDLLNIKLVDHVIIGNGEWYSFSDNGLL